MKDDIDHITDKPLGDDKRPETGSCGNGCRLRRGWWIAPLVIAGALIYWGLWKLIAPLFF